MAGPLHLLVPGALDTRTGGYLYDRQIADGLRALGWTVTVHELDAGFPFPSAAALADAARVLKAIPDRATVLIDGLAFGAMPREAAAEADRLRLVALVHHPLAAETGLTADAAAALAASERAALAAARRVIVTSRATAAALAGYGVARERIAVVEPGTARAPKAAGSTDGTVALLCVATVTPRKGHEVLIRALAALPALPWRLTCAGSLDRDPQTVDRVRALIAAHGLGARVTLAGELDERELAAQYDAADVFVLATEYEGYGMAVAEAVARGLPVIGTPTGAIPDLVSPRSGILVAPGDDAALAAALETMIGRPEARRRFAAETVLRRDRLPSWPVAALRMADALTAVEGA